MRVIEYGRRPFGKGDPDTFVWDLDQTIGVTVGLLKKILRVAP